MSEAATLKQVRDNVEDLVCKVSTLKDLGLLFIGDNALCMPGCVIEDYSNICLSLLDELETQICSLQKQSVGFDALLSSSLQVSPAAQVQ